MAMTLAQMTDAERRRHRSEKLDLYQRAVDDRKNYCGVLESYIETFASVPILNSSVPTDLI